MRLKFVKKFAVKNEEVCLAKAKTLSKRIRARKLKGCTDKKNELLARLAFMENADSMMRAAVAKMRFELSSSLIKQKGELSMPTQ